MSAQHAPHTPPMWRKFLSLPHTRLGWWAVGLSGVGVALVFMLFMLGRFFGIIPEGPVGALLTTLLITGLLGGGVVGSIALGTAERSLLVWVAQVPTALFFAFFTSFFLGEGDYPPWVLPSLGVLFWALIALGIIYLMRSAERNNVRWFE